MKKPYDPKLREIAVEFENLCEKYDVAASCLFVSPTHSEFVNHISPTWSVMRLQDGMIRFRSKAEDFPSKEIQHERTEATAHVLTSILEWSRQTNETMRSVLQQLGKHMKIAWSVWNEPDSTPGDGL
ncbi:hypothetical protein E6Q11_02375 [Candidatus Dojkabacteria bacterium]|uniref:Uncharacterized protein n=1 Tax=Candidatus Dojkabacteria bacterium TaxID=2099670 RepID=A0A5C7J920_9BACT|nr:MAG: hypothetical protein E6Q11_02375 [Candidatus Dojkabacteria bacterium]